MTTSDTSTPPTTATSHAFESFDGFAAVTLLPDLNKVQWADIDSIGTALVAQMEAQKTPKRPRLHE